jgi:hypothetical protein
MAPVRRAFASIVLGVGLLCGSLTLAIWWLRHTVMEPSRTAEVVDALIAKVDVRQEVAGQIGAQIGEQLGVDPATVTGLADEALQRTEVIPLLAQLLRDAHGRLIGESRGPVVLDPTVAATLLGDERVALLPPVTFDVPTIAPLDSARRSIDGVILAGLVFAVGFTMSGLVMHPTKPSALRTIGVWLLAASVLQLFVGFVIPVLIVPELWNNPWAEVVGETARAATAGLVAVLVGLAATGIVCLLVAAAWRPLRWATAS